MSDFLAANWESGIGAGAPPRGSGWLDLFQWAGVWSFLAGFIYVDSWNSPIISCNNRLFALALTFFMFNDFGGDLSVSV